MALRRRAGFGAGLLVLGGFPYGKPGGFSGAFRGVFRAFYRGFPLFSGRGYLRGTFGVQWVEGVFYRKLVLDKTTYLALS